MVPLALHLFPKRAASRQPPCPNWLTRSAALMIRVGVARFSSRLADSTSVLLRRYLDHRRLSENFPRAFLVPAAKAPCLQMNFNRPSLPRQVLYSPDIAAVIRHAGFRTGRAARRVLGAYPENYAVGPFFDAFQYQLTLRRQRVPHNISTLAHLFNLSNVSSLHPPQLHRK
jgi:hypothetical protein